MSELQRLNDMLWRAYSDDYEITLWDMAFLAQKIVFGQRNTTVCEDLETIAEELKENGSTWMSECLDFMDLCYELKGESDDEERI